MRVIRNVNELAICLPFITFARGIRIEELKSSIKCAGTVYFVTIYLIDIQLSAQSNNFKKEGTF